MSCSQETQENVYCLLFCHFSANMFRIRPFRILISMLPFTFIFTLIFRFFRSFIKILTFVLKMMVHFPSISFFFLNKTFFPKYEFVLKIFVCSKNNAHLYLEMLKPQYRDESFHKKVQLPFLKQKYVLGRLFWSVEILRLHI